MLSLEKGEWAILEADESDGSFLNYQLITLLLRILIMSILITIKILKNLEKSFIKFIEKTPPTGKSIVCIDNKNIKKIFKKIKSKNILTYGESKNSNYQIYNIRYRTDYSIFDLKYVDINKKIKKLKKYKIKITWKA